MEKLSDVGKPVSKNTACKVIVRNEGKRNGLIPPSRKLATQNLPSVRTQALIKKVAKAIHSPNPQSQRQMAKKFKTSTTTINRPLKVDLDVKVRKKRKTHTLTPEQAEQRLALGPEFLQFLTPRKLRYIFTMDETWVSTNDLIGEKNIYYKQENVEIPEEWKILPKCAWPKKSDGCNRNLLAGKSRAYIVQGKAKVNADYFIQHILKPIVEKDIPQLYGNDSRKVIVHMDSAPAHTAKKTYQWLDEREIKYISKEKWMANSPDLSPCDYAVNGIFKKKIAGKTAKCENALERVVKREWDKLENSKIQ